MTRTHVIVLVVVLVLAAGAVFFLKPGAAQAAGEEGPPLPVELPPAPNPVKAISSVLKYAPSVIVAKGAVTGVKKIGSAIGKLF